MKHLLTSGLIGGAFGIVAYFLFFRKATVEQVLKDAFDNLLFKTGTADILPSSYPSLDGLADVLTKSNWGLEITGHTDSTGNESKNLVLSKDRAENVKKYLVKKGVFESKIKTFGLGQTKPIAPNNTKEGRDANRRVEFVIIK